MKNVLWFFMTKPSLHFCTIHQKKLKKRKDAYVCIYNLHIQKRLSIGYGLLQADLLINEQFINIIFLQKRNENV